MNIKLEVYWGNDDASSSINLHKDIWNKIQNGENFEIESIGWYEGEEFNVTWVFNNRKLTLHDLKEECIRIEELDINELICEDTDV